MKKKKLKNLNLHKHRISDLTLLHRKNGGNNQETTGSEITSQSETNPTGPYIRPTEETLCYSYCDNCGTNGGTLRTPPPTEYDTCQCQSPGLG